MSKGAMPVKGLVAALQWSCASALPSERCLWSPTA